MTDYIFHVGILGGLITVVGAAWPEKKNTSPTHSVKNWLFAIGALLLFLYAFFDFKYAAGHFFFVLLEALVIVASVMMMFDFKDKIDAIVLSSAGGLFILWSLFLYEGFNTLLFIVGLTAVSLGYAFQMGSKKRSIALTFGSLVLAFFSFLVANWIFFWLNTFFFLFAGYYLIGTLKKI